MEDIIYLRAKLDTERFAVPVLNIIKILSDALILPLPDAPEGIWGIAYDEGEIFPVRFLGQKRGASARLIILCRGAEAYAADFVETMGRLADEELSRSQSYGGDGILLLDKKGIE